MSQMVSALVTAFNHERFIEAAIESLLAQTYRNIEIIVVDDRSQDRTAEMALRYGAMGVRVLRGPGQGPSMAMNLAMSEARGDIFLLQSGDDVSDPSRAGRQVEALATADLVACHPLLIDDDGRPLPDERFSIFFRGQSGPEMKTLFRALYEDGNFVCAPSITMRRAVWEKLGGFHAGLLQLQDYEYWMRALALGFSLSIAPDRLVSYRLHPANLSDVRNDVRTQRELATLMRGLAPIIPESFLRYVLYGSSFDGLAWRHQDRRMLLALFLLRHPSELVRQIGVDAMIAVMADPQFETVAQERFGPSRKAMFRAMLHK